MENKKEKIKPIFTLAGVILILLGIFLINKIAGIILLGAYFLMLGIDFKS